MRKRTRSFGAALAVLLMMYLAAALFAVPASAAASIKVQIFYYSEYTAVKVIPINAEDTVYYTYDGNDPTTSSAVYTKKLGFKKATVLKLAEYSKTGEQVGKMKTVEILRLIPKPKFFSEDNFNGTVDVDITDELEGAVIHFTINGSDPTAESPVLEEGKKIRVKKDITLKAIAVKEGWQTSAVAELKPMSLVTESSYDEYIQTMFELTNAERKKNGLKPVVMNEKLMAVAQLRAEELVKNYNHIRPNGNRWTTALKEAGYIHWYAAENYGKLDRKGIDPEGIIELWMDSEMHRHNMLNEKAKDVGFGFVQYEGYCYWVQIFGDLMENYPG